MATREKASAPTTSATEPTRIHHADNDVLTTEEMRLALQLSERQWSRVSAHLPVSYALGRQSPRYIYGEVLNYLRRTGAADRVA